MAQLVDTRNMTLEWPRPAGRVERYSLRWAPASDEVPGAGAGAGAGAAAEPASRDLAAASPPPRTERALLDGLLPGVGYTVSIAAHSYNLTSDLFTMETRTRVYSTYTLTSRPDIETHG